MNFPSTKQIAKRFARLSPPKSSPWYKFDSTTNKYTPLLRPRAGLKTFCNLPSPVQAVMVVAGRIFAVANNVPYEVMPDGSAFELQARHSALARTRKSKISKKHG